MEAAKTISTCYHCGEDCVDESIVLGDKTFCCSGCKTVYSILQQSDMCTYYQLNDKPGANQRIQVRKEKFAFLDDTNIAQKLIHFTDGKQSHVTFYLPQIHCSSCLWLLEHIYKIEPGIISARVHFTKKEVDIVFEQGKTSLRKIAETLTSIGYEPYISLQNLQGTDKVRNNSLTYQLGIAGFCFANVMLLSFPEYLGLEHSELYLQKIFRYISFLLALPVLLYSALPFYKSAYSGLQHKYMNIDAPIALAIIITFLRSCYEIFWQIGSGYFDSMTGIVFFMLVGRILQEKTYQQLSFDRDYKSYFPIAVTVIKDGVEATKALPDITVGDTLLIHNNELIPADGILTRGKAYIDYSFVTGESIPVLKEMGELIYAGGKQTGGNMELLVMKEVSQSYLTRLWNNDAKKQQKATPFTDVISKYFSIIVLLLAITASAYWFIQGNDMRAWNVLTTILIVACPCALLLANTFTNGHILGILSNEKMYLKNADTIEAIANTTHIVFDKTGTITDSDHLQVQFNGNPLTSELASAIRSLVSHSQHPLSKAIYKHLHTFSLQPLTDFKEHIGAGIEGTVAGKWIQVGNATFIGAATEVQEQQESRSYVAVNGKMLGYFSFANTYRKDVLKVIQQLLRKYNITILSGDNDAERNFLQHTLGSNVTLKFQQSPNDKLQYIQKLQAAGAKVTMLGDGLNDSGALRQSDAGIALTEDTNNFTPASDAILEASSLHKLLQLIQLTKANRKIIIISFIVSILYNVIGLAFALQGTLSPLVAAILMPASSISIVVLTYGLSHLHARWMRL